MDISSPTPSDQQYALKWNDFQSSILSSFRHLRDEEDFVDVTLACDQRSFTAHKVKHISKHANCMWKDFAFLINSFSFFFSTFYIDIDCEQRNKKNLGGIKRLQSIFS